MKPNLFFSSQLRLTLCGFCCAIGSFGLAGCGGESLNFGKVTPDEFRVVAKAPLVLPPDYDLRPPVPGEPRPQELQPGSAARQAILGQQAATERSLGEKLFVEKAGAATADPLIRYVVDDEFGGEAHKDKSFADTILFWKPRPTVTTSSVTDTTTETPLDAQKADAEVKSLIGDKPVIIRRAPDGGFKLPGL